MEKDYFVKEGSIVRQIWGKGDTILFVFAGASAEFALNKAVDWLYFTGKLPTDPLGRLFSTVSYARAIVFSETKTALKAIDTINAIHNGIVAKRGAKIPDWAYRDVLFMLIDYSIRSFEVLERKLSISEKEEVFDVFNRVGIQMKLKDLPQNFQEWEIIRKEHLQNDMQNSNFTEDLYLQYQKHLGLFRYKLLLETQMLICPQKVQDLLNFRRKSLLNPVLSSYKLSRKIKMDGLLRNLILPAQYKKEIAELDRY